jgi:hypothetical protein
MGLVRLPEFWFFFARQETRGNDMFQEHGHVLTVKCGYFIGPNRVSVPTSKTTEYYPMLSAIDVECAIDGDKIKRDGLRPLILRFYPHCVPNH